MKYSSVRVAELKGIIEKALNDITSYNYIMGSINGYNSSTAYDKAHNALTNVMDSSKCNGNINSLEKDLKKLRQACNVIVKYQGLEDEIESLKAKASQDLNPEKYQYLINLKTMTLQGYETKIDAILK